MAAEGSHSGGNGSVAEVLCRIGQASPAAPIWVPVVVATEFFLTAKTDWLAEDWDEIIVKHVESIEALLVC